MKEIKTQVDQKLNGFLLINKPPSITSFDVIRHLKIILKSKNKKQKTKIGKIKLENAIRLDKLKTSNDIEKHLLQTI